MAKMRYYRATGIIFFPGVIDHTPQILLRAFWGTGAIVPVS
jgi:hypothetical protein